MKLRYRDREIEIADRWEDLTPSQYVSLTANLSRMACGETSLDEVQVRLLCDLTGWQAERVSSDEDLSALLAIARRLTFPVSRTRKGELKLNLCFARNLLPMLYVGGKPVSGYTVSTDYGQLSCSLAALQYLEAREVASLPEPPLPLLASMLYCHGQYDSQQAQQRAHLFERDLSPAVLTAVWWNFLAVSDFLFRKTEFRLLTQLKPSKPSAIVTDSIDALYDLCADGLGGDRQVEQMNVLTYLRLLRKKTIGAVRQLRQLKMDTPTIAAETGLPVAVVNDIVN